MADDFPLTPEEFVAALPEDFNFRFEREPGHPPRVYMDGSELPLLFAFEVCDLLLVSYENRELEPEDAQNMVMMLNNMRAVARWLLHANGMREKPWLSVVKKEGFDGVVRPRVYIRNREVSYKRARKIVQKGLADLSSREPSPENDRALLTLREAWETLEAVRQ